MKAINLHKLAVKTLKFDGATEHVCHVRSRVDAINGIFTFPRTGASTGVQGTRTTQETARPSAIHR